MTSINATPTRISAKPSAPLPTISQALDITIARVDIFGGEPVVNDYRFDEKMFTDGTMSFKSFDGYTEEWTDFVYPNRDESIVPPYKHPYDVFFRSKFTTCRITQMRFLSANHFSLVCY